MEKEIRQEGDYTITEGIHGDTYHHPSFGMLSFSRTHGGHSNLFGSSIQHRDTIHMVLKEGTIGQLIQRKQLLWSRICMAGGSRLLSLSSRSLNDRESPLHFLKSLTITLQMDA